MSKHLFVTGTGTDVGKTYVTALLVKKLKECGKNAAYFKAAMSGNERGRDGSLISGDSLFVKKISGISQHLEEMCPYLYEAAYSPHLAAGLEGNPVELGVVKQCFDRLSAQYDYVTVEGSGGIICPIRYGKGGEEKILLEHIIKELGLSCLIVADAGLGTINHLVLTVSYMRIKNIPIRGIILNRFHPGNVMEEDNRRMCEELTGEKILACVGENDSELSIDSYELEQLFREQERKMI